MHTTGYRAARSRRRVRLLGGGLCMGVLTGLAVQAPAMAGEGSGRPTSRVVVRAVPGEVAAATALTERLGGRVGKRLPIIDGFAARVPAAALGRLQASPDVLSVTPDVSGHVMGKKDADSPEVAATADDTGSLYAIARIIGATDAWREGWTGKGVDVAVIDTGVSPVNGLNSGNVVNGPDLSFDSQRSDVRYLDTYGHGTHMAGIIAGRDAAGTPASYDDPKRFNGIAPDARIINVKVGATDGAADVSQVIAAIDWVAQHAHDPGLNIRVLNLSFGTDSTQSYSLDPLAYAAEIAWRKGVLVVVAGGNDGTRNVDLANPALNPNLLAVGAEDPNGTLSVLDDTIPDFANRGTAMRHVDVVAPGTHVLGLRVPNGVIDQAYPTARVGTRLFRGSGTSQATAVVSGAAALLLQHYPSLTPQQAKLLLGYGATWLAAGTTLNAGAGVVNVKQSMSLAGSSLFLKLATQPTAPAGTGTGSLQLARGSSRVTANGVALTGEQDIFGTAFSAPAWSAAALAGTSWSSKGQWNGTAMTGTGWVNGNWSTTTWPAASWSGLSWTDSSWEGRRWANGSWDCEEWEGRRWAASGWEGRRWAGASWS